MDKWEEETQSDREAIRRVIDASFDRESAIAERLRKAKQDCDQIWAEIGSVKTEDNVLAAAFGTGKRNPARDDVLVKYRMGLDTYRGRQYAQALRHFEKVLTMAPYSSWADDAQLKTARCNLALGDKNWCTQYVPLAG